MWIYFKIIIYYYYLKKNTKWGAPFVKSLIRFLDLLQPFRDGLKLLRKEREALIYKVNYFIHYVYPMILIIFMLFFSYIVPC